MPSLADRLKSLGVSVGPGELKPKKPAIAAPIHEVVDGEYFELGGAKTFEVTETFSIDTLHGGSTLHLGRIQEIIAAWASIPDAVDMPIEKFLFLDTETSGLAASSGTVAFMIGAGRFMEGNFVLKQFFLPGPADEVAQLHQLETFAKGIDVIVSFNGKSFDMPLLKARFITRQLEYPWADTMQLDLLHLARRVWKYRLPDRSLGYLEEHVLGLERTGEDTPGWMIPDLYFDYLKSGDSRPLRGVFYHNEVDILSMVTLMQRINGMLAEPETSIEHAEDLLAVARLYENFGPVDMAAALYENSLGMDLPENLEKYGRKLLSFLHKRNSNKDIAISLWMQAAADRELYAFEELAKHYEHFEKNIGEALRWTDSAIALVQGQKFSRIERVQWEDPLLHREKRLKRKSGKIRE